MTATDTPQVDWFAVNHAQLMAHVDRVRRRVEALAASGVTELAYQPAASGPERDLRAFAEALGLAPAGT